MKKFITIIDEHSARYPLMKPQDYVMLAYQSEFGSSRMTLGKEEALRYLAEEWNMVKEKFSHRFSYPPEYIGNGFSRFHLDCSYGSEESVRLLTDLFLKSTGTRIGSEEKYLEKLDYLRGLKVPGMAKWIDEYKKQGYSYVHHSKEYHEAYAPHYRVIRDEWANYYPVIFELYKLVVDHKKEALAAGRKDGDALPDEKQKNSDRIIIAIDGRCGSGKNILSKILKKLFNCFVVHIDDYYIPFEKCQTGWEAIPGGNIDFDRLEHELLIPFQKYGKGLYRKYDFEKDEFGDTVDVEANKILLLEGCYSHHPRICDYYDKKIFLICSREVQKRRLSKREGDNYNTYETRWIPLEEIYFNSFGIEEESDIVVDTDSYFD